jgi:pyruvate dehydrogenase E2 component (dihydrolipoamide acetyltransferase)
LHQVTMPRLSDSMEEGTIIRWLKADGDAVRRGDEIVEIETDKATMAYEAEADGTLSILVGDGATAAVGTPIATIGVAAATPAAPTPASPPAAAAPASSAPASESASNGGGAHAPAAAVAAAAAGVRAAGTRINSSPLARRIAQRLGVDLASVEGTGPHGRIVKADVIAATPGSTAVAVPAAAPVAAPAAAPVAAPAPLAVGDRDATIVELSKTQGVVARRMVESRATVPDFALEVDVDMTAAVAMRSELKQIADPAPSLNDLVIKACAIALRRHPRANGSYREGRFELWSEVNVGLAVAAPDALVVPVVRNADAKSLGAIASETRALAERVRSSAITPPELSGGTFTVSNLGMFGIDRFEGIINVPQAAILCVGAVVERPVARDGQVVIAPQMTVTLACDHRILYGADAAQFLAEIRTLLEQPVGLFL